MIGPARCDEALDKLAYEVGAGLARAGFTVVTGGEKGAMEAASRGASEAGGLAVGVLPGTDRSTANDYADVTLVTGIGHARNLAVVASGDVVIAVGGEWGTLSEIGLAGVLGRPVVLVDGWKLEHRWRCRARCTTRATPRRPWRWPPAWASRLGSCNGACRP